MILFNRNKKLGVDLMESESDTILYTADQLRMADEIEKGEQ